MTSGSDRSRAAKRPRRDTVGDKPAALREQLDERTRELQEALEQQGATEEILRVISSCRGDIQPVLNAVAERAAHLCSANDVLIRIIEGDVMRAVAHIGSVATEETRAINRGTVVGTAVLECRTIHVHDTLEAHSRGQYTDGRRNQQRAGYRTMLVAPLRRQDRAIGAIVIRRLEVQPFSDRQVKLLETFAAQAAIAIENARLFQEIETRNEELSESLRQQTATAEILKVMSSSRTDAQPVFEVIVKSCIELFPGANVSLRLVRGSFIEMVASSTAAGSNSDRAPLPLDDPHFPASRAILRKAVVHIPDVRECDWLPEKSKDRAERRGFRAIVTAPMVNGSDAVGAISVMRPSAGAFAEKQIALLRMFADQAVIAIENVGLLNELNARNDDLTESLEQQTATAEILQAISASPTDVSPVLKAVTTRAAELCDAADARLYLLEGDALKAIAGYGQFEGVMQTLPFSRGLVSGRAIADRTVIHIDDLAASLNEFPDARGPQAQFGHRTTLAVPLIREDKAFGTILMRRNEVRPFTEKQIELVKTFAHQASIAIQNVRLFHETQNKSRELEAANRHKSEFLANMSHELRTPLNAIIGVTEMLREDARDLEREDEIEPLDRVLRAARHLLTLINDILDLSKIEAGKMELHLDSFDIEPLVRDIVTTSRTLAEKNGNALVLECGENLGAMYSDATRIRQILLNLTSNAAKFTERGTITLRARRESVAGREHVMLAVSDTGIGLSEIQISRLFEDFVQADASTTRKYGGTGLGLAISRRFCQMMGGDISVSSEQGKGSTFTVRLPASVGEPLAETTHESAASASRAANRTQVPLVLVVDDDASVRDVATRFLTREGFSVRTASTGAEGLRLVRELAPDAVTLDVLLPDIDGWDVLSALKGDPQLADIPVVLLSIVDEKKRGYSLGAADYMVKPVDRRRLVSVLRKVCHGVSGRALIIDDDESMRNSIRRSLEQDGWKVAEAETGRVGLRALSEARPDVILLDLMMPDLDGFGFLTALREQPQFRDIPVVVVTAKDLSVAEREMLNGGVQRVFQKNAASMDELLGDLCRLLASHIHDAHVVGRPSEQPA